MDYAPTPWDDLLADPPWWLDVLGALAAGMTGVALFYTAFEAVIFFT